MWPVALDGLHKREAIHHWHSQICNDEIDH
jgi:hypothetical protein